MQDIWLPRITLMLIPILAVLFGAYAVSLGHNGTVIASVFAIIGGVFGWVANTFYQKKKV